MDIFSEARKETHPVNAGVTGGEVEALPAGEDADHYVIIKKKQAKEADDSE
jgi:hypothetical protein